MIVDLAASEFGGGEAMTMSYQVEGEAEMNFPASISTAAFVRYITYKSEGD